MLMHRREVLKLVLAATTSSLAGCGSSGSSSDGGSIVLRTVNAADATDLQAIMTSTVCDADSFFGQCGEWSLAWAEDLIARCPETVTLFRGDVMIAFMELPSIRGEVPPIPPDATDEEQRRHAVRQRNRSTFRVTAAGVRDDLLERDESVQVFLMLLYQGFVRARDLGYEHVEAIAPWERHPRMTRKWTEYPGCELAEPVSYKATHVDTSGLNESSDTPVPTTPAQLDLR